MTPSSALPAAMIRPARLRRAAQPRRDTWPRFDARPRRTARLRRAAMPDLEDACVRLIVGGGLLNAGALAAFASLRCLGRLNLDTMTLLPAAACAGAAAASLGAALACLRALRGA